MNSIDRDRMFREAEDALVHAINTIVRTRRVDPLSLTFILVHRTSPVTYREALRAGASETEGGFALKLDTRSTHPDHPLAGLPADHIACMISIDDRHKAVGLSLDVLSPVSSAEVH